jgi:4-amino-4-deoxy-L-arabinose transferase-like glycosyltransferase
MLRTANGQAAMPVQQGVGMQRKVEVENGNIILYRTHNFFLRTAYRPERLNRDPLRKPTGNTTMLPRVMLDQNKRIANSETRVMPSITLDTNNKTRSLPIPVWLEAIFVMIALGFTGVLHAYNMFNFPRYELDEGTYMANAWAITQGLISPYPYGYGHPPLAWIQIGGWLELTGGVFTFGNALNSGRVLMLLYAVASTLLVYLIVRRFGGSRSAALLAMVIFAFSPLSITYQRQVFLDNIATFWMLVALYLLVSSNSRIVYLVGSALAFGCAVLSKEVLLICFPAFIYAAWLHITKFQRKFALVTFIYGVVAACSTFVLLAVLKGELFPYAWHLPWDTHQHLSLLDTLVGQVQRSESNGSFIDSWMAWLQNDPVFVLLSLAAPFFNLVYGWWNRKHLMLALLAISFWILLIRGGQVLSFYILPLIPLIALNVAIALNALLGWLGKLIHFNIVRAILLLLTVAVLLPYDITSTSFRFYQHPTSAQQEAMLWVRNHVPHNSFIVINSYLYLDLRVPGGEGLGDGAPYPHAEVYWNVAFDPEIHDLTLQNNWDRIDYIVADSEMEHDIENSGGGMDLIKQALDHSVLRAQFSADDHNLQIVIRVYQVQHKVPQPIVNTGPVSAPAAALSWQEPPGIGVALADRRRTG